MEIYKTLLRSFSASTNEVQLTSPTKQEAKTCKTWIHPPDVLVNGRVEYTARLLGSTLVSKSNGTDTIRGAIQAILRERQVIDEEAGQAQLINLQRVDLQVNVEGLTIVDSKTKMVLYRYPIKQISFCSDDKRDTRLFSFIATADSERRYDCFVFLADKVAEQITLTIEEACQLAFKNSLAPLCTDQDSSVIRNRKQQAYLQRQIRWLKEENQALTEENQALTRLVAYYRSQTDMLLQAPLLPTSPVPAAPRQVASQSPAQFETGSSSGESGTDASYFERAPPETLVICETATALKIESSTPKDFDPKLFKVDQRFSESSFSVSSLETGDSLRDVDVENEYMIPNSLIQKLQPDNSKGQ